MFDGVIALLFDGEKPKLYLREEAEAPILHAIVQARAEIVRQHEEIAGYIAAYKQKVHGVIPPWFVRRR